MNTVIYMLIVLALILWYVRPIYNFMAKRKYVLLDTENLSLSRRLQSSLPAIAFYSIIFVLMFAPAVAKDLIGATQTGSILLAQILFIFLISRYDKWQTKYKVLDEGVRFRRRFIKWDERYTVSFKKSAFLILHKPRFTLKSNTTKITIPMLSKNIEKFIARLSYKNKELGSYAKEIYDNTRAYYVKNLDIEKQLKKYGKKI